MKHFFEGLRALFLDKNIVWNIIASVTINAVTWALAVIHARPSNDLIPLHYNIYFGIDLIGNWYQIFLIPGIGTILLLANVVAAHFLGKPSNVIRRSYFYITTILEIILLASLVLLLIFS